MADPKRTTARVIVLGDLAIDWNVSQSAAALPWERNVWSNPTAGGAWLLAKLTETALALDGVQHHVEAPAPLRNASARSTACVHSHLLLRSFEVERKVDGVKRKVAVWKAGELLGYTRMPVSHNRKEPEGAADLLIIDDANFGYRDRVDDAGKPVLPQALADGPKQILYKASAPIGKGPLWKAVAKHDRVVALLHVDDLRAAGCQITQGISWERTCEELTWALRFHPALDSLDRCQTLVVQFPATAAVVYERLSPGDASDVRCRLVYDPTMMEGQWLAMQPGHMVGLTATLAATLAAELVRDPAAPDLAAAAARGLGAGRTLHEIGFLPERRDPNRLRFPATEALRRGTDKTFARVELPKPWTDDFRSEWTILDAVCGKTPVADIARTTLLQGLGSGLSGVPVATFNHLETVDRGEIEGYNAIRNLVSEYLGSAKSKPISIGVFGPPGSGKSFGIGQIASALSKDIQTQEFNLSQFNDPTELASALHVVRDIGLKGKIPLVFWDEFDSSRGTDEKLFWLKYFLMPMQDGKFREGELEHPIGRAIFVFAGGTSNTFREFGERDLTREAKDFFPSVKGPDFISRLKGHIDIMGPNPRELESGTRDPADRYWPIRRAIVLRSLFMRGYKQLMQGAKLNIEPGVANAFLEVSKFKHGVRSMESIIAMSTIGDRKRYTSSSLPTAKQMSGHVNADEFNQILLRPELTEKLVDKLAMAIHATYCNHVATETAKQDFDQLSKDDQASNRAHAKFLYERLAAARATILPMRGTQQTLPFTKQELERLAIQEHDRWVAEHKKGGWAPGYPKDKPGHIHPDLVDWDDLPEGTKQKDRNFVVDLPRYLRLFGYSLQHLDRTPAPNAGDAPKVTRIGVIGRRNIEDSEDLRAGIDKVLETIRTECPPDSQYAIASPLAEGGDQLVTRLTMKRLGAILTAVLPLPEKEYLATFDSDAGRASLQEFLAAARHRPKLPPVAAGSTEAAFEQAGLWVVDDARYIIAIWDNKPDKGQGGTADAVQYAREKARKEGKTLFIIDPTSGTFKREP